MAALAITSPYRMKRLTGFLDPWADPYDSGFQLTQALIAFGRGEWAGVGLGNGIQKQFYLPEAHTDFLMAVIGEEFGFLGTLAVILLLPLRGILHGRPYTHAWTGYLCMLYFSHGTVEAYLYHTAELPLDRRRRIGAFCHNGSKEQKNIIGG